MSSSFHMHLIKLVGQIFFLLHSILLIIPACFYRLGRRLFKKEQLQINPFNHTHQDVFKSRQQILRVKGFEILEYDCETKDNAFVSFWRIVPLNVPQQNSKMERKPVLIQHGLLDCSMSWFLHQNIENCLPYLLAKEGYDVWVGNNRGTKYSSKNSHNKQYWEYNFDHIVEYDFPVLIDFVLKESSKEKMIYIGHSQGTAQFLCGMDKHEKIGRKIECFIGFGPLISLKNLENHKLIKIMDRTRLCEILKKIGFKTLLIIPNWMSKLIGILIYNSFIYFNAFFYIVTGLCGKNKAGEKINLQRFGVIISHEPGGSSINNVLHWIQIYRKGEIHKFDYGKSKNKELYGNQQPPKYTFDSLKNQQFDFILFKGTSDKVISEKDFDNLIQKLNPQKCIVHQVEDYAHLDYIWSEHAYKDIYPTVLKLIRKEY